MELQRVKKWIDGAPKKYAKLLLIIGKSGQMEYLARQLDYPYINLNLELSSRLLDIPENKRAVFVNNVFADILDSYESPTIFIDKIEILFTPQLQVNPLKLLELHSRNRAMVVLWPGLYDGGYLIYAEPNHPEYRKYKVNGSFDILNGEVLK